MEEPPAPEATEEAAAEEAEAIPLVARAAGEGGEAVAELPLAQAPEGVLQSPGAHCDVAGDSSPRLRGIAPPPAGFRSPILGGARDSTFEQQGFFSPMTSPSSAAPDMTPELQQLEEAPLALAPPQSSLPSPPHLHGASAG